MTLKNDFWSEMRITFRAATMASTDFDEKAKEAIPGEVHMISGSHDIQTSADVSNVGSFQVRN